MNRPHPDSYEDHEKWREDYKKWMDYVKEEAIKRVDRIFAGLETNFILKKLPAHVSHAIGTGTRPFTLQIKDFKDNEGTGAFFAHFSMSYENVIKLQRSIEIAIEDYENYITKFGDDNK